MALLLIAMACEDDDPSDAETLSDITVSYEVAADDAGTVTITAMAEGAVSYTFDFGDGSTENPLSETS